MEKTNDEILERDDYEVLNKAKTILDKLNEIDFNSADTATINDALNSLNEVKTLNEKAKEIIIKKFDELNKLHEDKVKALKDLASQRSTVAQQVANQYLDK